MHSRVRALLQFGGAVGIAVASIALGGTLAYGASGGYGPSAAIPNGVPGGFTNVLVAHTFTYAGGKIRARVDGVIITIGAPRGSMVSGTQLAITTARNGAIREGLGNYSRFRILAAAGVVLDFHGAPRTSRRPIAITVMSHALRAHDIVVVYRSGHFITAGRELRNGILSFDIRGVTEFVVLAN